MRKLPFVLQLAFPVFALLAPSAKAEKPIKVFLLAGQSNMQGQAVVDLDHEDHYNGGRGTLVRLMEDPAHVETYAHLRDDAGQWAVRDDVRIRYQLSGTVLKSGGLGIGYGGYDDPHHFGIELQFGHVVGNELDEPVLLIKTAWGGKSLHVDFRPPSAGGETGPYYTKMIAEIRATLADLGAAVPGHAGADYEISGFVWFQGWNDMYGDEAPLEYESNLIHLIDDVRAEFDVPKLPVVIGETGNGSNMEMRAGQAAVAMHEAFLGTVTFVPTAQFLRRPEDSPNTGHGHHWFGNAESYFLIGDAMGRAMLNLIED